MYYVYLIQNNLSGDIYIGYTHDTVARIKQHNSGGKKFTTKKGVWRYIYIELYRSKYDALDRERKLKNHGKGKYDLLKRLKHSLLEPKIGEGSAA